MAVHSWVQHRTTTGKVCFPSMMAVAQTLAHTGQNQAYDQALSGRSTLPKLHPSMMKR